MNWRFIPIVLLSPLVTAMPALVFPNWIALVVFGYPFIVAASALLLIPVHAYLQKTQLKKIKQVLVVMTWGTVGGILFTLLFYLEARSRYDLGEIISTTLPFALLGAVQALAMWALYTFGPLKVSRVSA